MPLPIQQVTFINPVALGNGTVSAYARDGEFQIVFDDERQLVAVVNRRTNSQFMVPMANVAFFTVKPVEEKSTKAGKQ